MAVSGPRWRQRRPLLIAAAIVDYRPDSGVKITQQIAAKVPTG